MNETHQLIPPYFAQWWPEIERQLDTVPHIWEKWWTKDMLFAAIECGAMQCWVSLDDDKRIRLVIVSQVANHPGRRCLQVILALGNSLEAMLPAVAATLERFAQTQECAEVEILGRQGWLKLLQPYGFKLQSVMISREVELRRLH